LFRAGRRLVDPLLVRRLTSQLPSFLTDRVQGMADVSKSTPSELMTAMVLPDLLPLLEVFAYRIRPKSFIEVVPPPRFGCSSFIARGSHFLHGRNLDFPGVAYWDRYQVIQVTEPQSGLRYIGFTTAGAPICGITGINEAQISVSLHQHYCREASLRGEPPFSVGERILNRAKTLDEAVEILKSSRLVSSWAFILTDGKTRDALIYECHPKASGIRRLSPSEAPHLAHANYFQTDNCRPAEFATTARMNWDNHARKSRLDQLVTEAGDMTPEQAARIISDQYDPYWGEEKIINRTVSQVYNVQSLVLDSEKMKVYLAEGNAPVQGGRYQEYDLGEMFAGGSGKTAVSFPGYRFVADNKVAAKQEYILSFVAAFDGNFEEAFTRLCRALDSDFVPEAAYVAGIIRMKLGDLKGGRDLLQKGRDFIEQKVKARRKTVYPPEYFEITLFLARAFDLTDQRSQAESLYREVAEHPDLQDAHLRRIAQGARRYRPAQLAKILMPYSSYIPFE
jgi:hypothetical protein